jgi:uncharacterized membrane protein
MNIKKILSLLVLSFSINAFAGSDFTCGGTEPFWSLYLVGNEVSLSMPLGDEPTKEQVISRINATNIAEDVAFVIKTETASLTIIAGACSDGMSEDIYTHHIVYNSGDSMIYGCCNQFNHNK